MQRKTVKALDKFVLCVFILSARFPIYKAVSLAFNCLGKGSTLLKSGRLPLFIFKSLVRQNCFFSFSSTCFKLLVRVNNSNNNNSNNNISNNNSSNDISIQLFTVRQGHNNNQRCFFPISFINFNEFSSVFFRH